MNRGKFTDELHQKCKEYSEKQMIKNNMIWETYARSCIDLLLNQFWKNKYCEWR